MKLGLGTVQLGLNYGISNKTGKPNKEEAINILKHAVESGIEYFDTASSYGGSEQIIGEFLKQVDLRDRIKISTKIRPIKAKNKYELKQNIFHEVNKSLQRLGVGTLDFCLLHDVKDLCTYGLDLIYIYQELIDKNLISQFGVSTYNPEDIDLCLNHDIISVIQVPFNIFDYRLIENNSLARLKEKGVTIHSRSTYLQGLLLMDHKEILRHLSRIIPYLKILEKECDNLNLSKIQTIFCYVRDNSYIDNFFIGCETLDQLNKTIELNNSPRLPLNVLNQLGARFSNIPENILNPALWK